MKKIGKYEKRPKADKVLLQTYFTSLVGLMLCVTMFFGTTYAWFTSEVNNSGNEIYIGTLDVDLDKKDGDEWVSLDSVGGSAEKLYTNAVRWEPGFTSVETVRVTNKGDLAFNYELTFTDGMLDGAVSAELQPVAQWFDIWVYHDNDNRIPDVENYEQVTEANGWKKAGTLAEAMNGKPVFEGGMDKNDVVDAATFAPKDTAHTYTIALHMNESAEASVMGKKISLNVKLIAYQMSSEEDGIGSGYDQGVTLVNTEAQLTDALNKGDSILMTEDITLKDAIVLSKAVNIDLGGHILTTNTVTIDTEKVTVSNGDWALDPVNGAPPVIVKSDLTLKNVDVSCNKVFYTYSNFGEAVAMSVEGGSLTVEGGSIAVSSNGGTGFSFAYCVALMNGATFDMKGGTLSAFEPTGAGEAGESSFAVLANGSGTMNASLRDVEISSAHYIAGANGATLNIVLKDVRYDNVTTVEAYEYQNGKCVVTKD